MSASRCTNIVGEKIARLAKAHGSVLSFARATGISKTTMARYAAAENEPKATAIRSIASTARVSVDWLVAPEPPGVFRTIVRVKAENRP
jgi:transcriptional regulator with XRE-family HTH domain